MERRGIKGESQKLKVRHTKGFTLVEMILVIVLMGIVSGIGLQLITPVFQGYVNTKNTDQMFGEAKFAVERISRELRQAIPNSIRLTPSNGLQFCQFDYSGYYVDDTGDDTIIRVDNNTSFGILAVGNQISIYNTTESELYGGGRVYSINGKNGTDSTIQLDKSVEDSPYSRYYQLSTPVTYYLQGTTILRSFGYSLGDVARGTNAATNVNNNILVQDVTTLTIQYNAGTLERNATVDIDIVLQKGDTEVSYGQRVQIRNRP